MKTSGMKTGGQLIVEGGTKKTAAQQMALLLK